MKKSQQSGFALLMSLLVVSVVVSVGLTLVDITLKQLRLATGAKESEAAFQAAAAGVECLRYHRNREDSSAPRHPYEEFEDGSSVNTTCFGVAHNNVTATPLQGNPIYKYEFEYSWGGRCTKATMITINSPFAGALTLSSVPTHIPGYPNASKSCEPGGRCTILAVQGYNRPCNQANQVGTVQREILVEL